VTRLGLILGLAALALAGVAAIQLWPAPQRWHTDPATVIPPGRRNHWLMRDGADAPAIRLDLAPDAAAAMLARIAEATPRTRLVSGGGLWTTWLTRSRLMGYPDTTSVLIRPDGTGSEVLIYARSHIGYRDLGVNRARAEAWAAAMTAP
jgi:uncharacterized protein (DUF1499 family)